MPDQVDEQDFDANPWRRPGVLIPCAGAAVMALAVALIYLMPVKMLASLPSWVPHPGRSLGIDELGGSRIVLEVDPAPAGAVETTMTVVRRRVRLFGVPDPVVAKLGANRILVEAPGYEDVQRMSALIVRSAKLTFQIVDDSASEGGASPERVPPDDERLPTVTPNEPFLVLKKHAVVTGSMLKSAEMEFDTRDSRPAIGFQLDETGTRHFATATSIYAGRRFAIVLDGKVISAPLIHEPITAGRGQITGDFTPQSATELALLLNSDALPEPVKVIEQARVAPRP